MRKWNYGYNSYVASENDIKRSVGKGWSTLLDRVFDKLPIGTPIYDVKEKWGGLRIYVGGVTEEINNFISDIETESCSICEFCGESGKQVRLGGWVKTICPECEEEDKEVRHILYI